MTADEILKQNVEKMGEPLGTQYSALWQEVALIHINWNEYVELFGTKQERIELLNRAAPMFFRMLQDRLWETALLHLARLTDPPNSLGRKDKSNLTIQNLPALLDDAKLKDKLSRLISIAVKETEFSRDWRNRIIAHRDLNLALNQPATPIAGASRKQVNDALAAVTSVINSVEMHYKQSETRFELAPRHNGAVTLLYVLDDGLTAQSRRRERFAVGKPQEDDFLVRDL